MASLQIPGIAQFDPKGDPNTISQRWEKWKNSFGYFINASAITDDNRKKPSLLHLMGSSSQEVFETLPNKGDTYDEAVKALDEYFSVKKNIPYERSIFHSAKQESHESIDQYVTRLRKLTLYCDYKASTEENIRDQVIGSCKSTKFRTKLLQEKDLTLEKLIEIGQSREAASHQSKQMESHSEQPEYLHSLSNRQNRPYYNQAESNRGRGNNRGINPSRYQSYPSRSQNYPQQPYQ
jgi:hypothetical protein